MEPMPNLNVESRRAFEGWLYDSYAPLAEQVAPRIAQGLKERPVYIEKQNSLVPLIQQIHSLFGAKFIIPVRDGREVVTSLMNWHSQMFPIIYQECSEATIYSQRARDVLSKQNGADEFNYSLPRPLPNDPWFDSWSAFSRFEMCSWYWNFINQYLLEVTSSLPSDAYLFVDYTRPSVETIADVYRFIGLTDFRASKVSSVLHNKVNSLAQRGAPAGPFPHWTKWLPEQRRRFDEIAWESMKSCGYTTSPHRYATLSNGSLRIEEPKHPFNIRCVRKITSHMGSDVTLWATNKQTSSSRGTLLAVVDDLAKCPDIDYLVECAARSTDGALFLSASGYHPSLSGHRHQWSGDGDLYVNKVSPRALERQLSSLGFQSVAIFPTENEDRPGFDTAIIATRDPRPFGHLIPEELLSLTYEPYQAHPSGKSMHEILTSCNSDCFYLSDPKLKLANSGEYFERMLQDLKTIKQRRIGTLDELATGAPEVNCALRFDVDMDLPAALMLSKICMHADIHSSFYILHTAKYHGSVTSGQYFRNDAVASAYLQIQDDGNEVGLHVDPYFFYQHHGIDGAHAVEIEINWLREQGILVEGITGHNCASTYGAESVEIFSSFAIRPTPWFVRNFRYCPIGALDANALGIKYEGGRLTSVLAESPDRIDFINHHPKGYFLHDPCWMRSYLLDNSYAKWGYNYNLWLIGEDKWVIAGTAQDQKTFEFGLDWRTVVAFLRELDRKHSACLTLHPCHFGRRKSPNEAPHV
jgi:hypothetical protein